MRSINFSCSFGEMSVTQRSGLITTLPRLNKTKFYIKNNNNNKKKNWRPISLLGVDYQIASAVIAKRIQKVLPAIISHVKKTFLRAGL